MKAPFRLRQVAFVTMDLPRVTRELEQVFGLPVVYRDPSVGIYGLTNALFPFGDAFLEAVQPMGPEASAHRHWTRLGGDGGYMLILQGKDALADRARLVARGLTVIEAFGGSDARPLPADADAKVVARVKELSERYSATHFHPRDFNGLLVSLDSVAGLDWQERHGFWPPAMVDGPPAAPLRDLGIVETVIEHPTPEAAAANWNTLLGADGGNPTSVEIAGGRFTFTKSDSKVARIAELRVRAGAPTEVLAKAKAAGIAVADGALTICGTRFRPVTG